MQASAQAVSQVAASEVESRRFRLGPIQLLLAIVIAFVALSAVAAPTFAQDEGTTETTAAAEETAESAGQPVDLAPLGAGIAILSIIGPALGIGILAGMSSSAIGRNPDAGEQIRSLAVLMAAFAEGLGVIALVVGLLIALL
ncbi:MAG: ATP synthase F0 subunit C [Chloroflexota bacterium]|jgi:F-type H+-transporting ATPase subunit c